MTYSSDEVLENLQTNKAWRAYPERNDRRSADSTLWPRCTPSFTIDSSTRPAIFTIGSCFARHIEDTLASLGFELPTRQFVTPVHELANRGPHDLLNEFNAGTIAQRILYALSHRSFDERTLVSAGGNLIADLLLVKGAEVPWARALERRAEVDGVYRQLPRSQYILITLGLSETWFDTTTGLYLNRIPPFPVLKVEPERFILRKLETEESYALLEPAIAALVERDIKALITVSPVPLPVTMTRDDVILANESSKAALRVCAERLSRRFRHVDYFPSYEIVRSGGLGHYGADNIHVRPAIIQKVTRYMADAYCARIEAAA